MRLCERKFLKPIPKIFVGLREDGIHNIVHNACRNDQAFILDNNSRNAATLLEFQTAATRTELISTQLHEASKNEAENASRVGLNRSAILDLLWQSEVLKLLTKGSQEPDVIERQYGQRHLGEIFLKDSIDDCWEPWMRKADEILDGEELIEAVYEALRRRRPNSGTRGRKGTPAEVALRLLVLKHMRNWSFDTLEREVRANMVYRLFTRVGAEKVPDAKTLARIERALGPEVFQKVHDRIVGIARDKKVVEGRKMRVDTTVTETNIHYPTDSSLLGDGVRILTRTMKRIVEIGGNVGERVRDRMRSISHRVMEIARTSRSRAQNPGKEKLQHAYRRLLNSTGQVVAQAKRIADEVAHGIK